MAVFILTFFAQPVSRLVSMDHGAGWSCRPQCRVHVWQGSRRRICSQLHVVSPVSAERVSTLKLSYKITLYSASRGALEKWVEITGDESYSFENMLQWYKKSAEFTPPNEEHRLENSTTLYEESLWSDQGGPLQVGYPNWVNPISSWIARGLEHLGLKNLAGFSDGDINGYAYTTFSLDAKTQTRSSSQTSFLSAGLREDTNLNVYKSTMAKKILFDDNKKAIGAVVESGGMEYTLSASQEVIVSAGAVSRTS